MHKFLLSIVYNLVCLNLQRQSEFLRKGLLTLLSVDGAVRIFNREFTFAVFFDSLPYTKVFCFCQNSIMEFVAVLLRDQNWQGHSLNVLRHSSRNFPGRFQIRFRDSVLETSVATCILQSPTVRLENSLESLEALLESWEELSLHLFESDTIFILLSRLRGSPVTARVTVLKILFKILSGSFSRQIRVQRKLALLLVQVAKFDPSFLVRDIARKCLRIRNNG